MCMKDLFTPLACVLFAIPACAAQQRDEPDPPEISSARAFVPERVVPPLLYESDTPIIDQRLAMRSTSPSVGITNSVYTDIEPFLDPTLRAACGWERPTFYFPTESDDVGLIGEVKLETLAICLQNAPLEDEPIILIGHSDERGSASTNLELALARAESVKSELVARGIAPDRIETYSRGEYRTDDDGQYHDDRRVVVKLDQ